MTTCQSDKCTREAVYHCEVKFIGTEQVYMRDYCTIHVRQLGHGMAELIDKYQAEPLHNYLKVEHVDD